MLTTDDVTHFGDSCEWTGVTNANTEAWLQARREILTASDVACILGEAPESWGSAYKVYVAKICPPEPEEVTINSPLFWGAKLEQTILSETAAYYGWEYHPGGALLRSKKHPWLGCTLDAEIDRGRDWETMEGKTSQVTRAWDEEEEKLPNHVLIQAHSQLLVTGAPCNVVFALLVGCRPCQIDIEPNASLASVIIEKGEEFMDRVRRMDPPDPDHTDASKKALERMYSGETGNAVQLPKVATEWALELVNLIEESKVNERRQNQIRNLLRQSIGHASYGLLDEEVDGKRFFSWKTDKRGARTLRHVKHGPYVPEGFALPEASPIRTLVDDLRDSVAANEVTAPIKRSRRRNRR